MLFLYTYHENIGEKRSVLLFCFFFSCWWYLDWLTLILNIKQCLIFIPIFPLQCGFFKRSKPEGYEPTYQGEIKKKSKDYDNVDYT